MEILRNALCGRASKIAAAFTILAAALCLATPSSRPFSLQEAQEGASTSIEGQIRNLSGQPVAGVLVELQEDDEGRPAIARTLSQDNGSFALSVFVSAPGWFRLRLTKDGYPTQFVVALRLDRHETKRVDALLLKKGEHLNYGEATVPLQRSAIPPPEFYDTPNFTVAGVTDRSNLGLHGSDANVRTSDALTKEAAALKTAAVETGAKPTGAGDALRLAADAKEKSGDPVGAEKEYEAAVKLDPSEESYFAWGAELLLHHAGPATVQVFAKGSELHPFSARLRAGLGAAYYADGEYAEAAAQICRAADLNPSDAQPYLFLGKIEKAAAEPFPCSEEHLNRFVDEQPGNALAHYYYALVLWKKARKTQDAARISAAEGHLHRAAELDPSLGEVYLQLGLLYNARGHKDAALAQFQRAITAQPSLSSAHYQLSLAYRRAADPAKADAEMQKYEELRRSEDAELDKERREMRQFVTVLKDASSQKQ